ncbi:MAG TPA: NAD-glutamate dehydrogenase domain-containing protein [Candidatus Dormibacteraeota bacterium]|nr:NAD-glutamate dehydrogenase domain-containing protein [Candidatus Dormibacteraeota bacterium]
MASLQKAIAQLMEGRAEQRPTPPDGGSEEPSSPSPPGPVAPTPAPEAVSVEAFARELYGAGGAPADDPDATPRAAGALAFLRERTTPVKLRIFTPERVRDGWSSPLTVVETALDDRPFIVDTVRQFLQREGGGVRLLLHPIMGVERDASGRLRRVAAPDEGLPHESFVHVEVANLAPSPALQQRLAERLDRLVAVTDDYPAMRARLADLAAGLRAGPLPEPWEPEREEAAAFLDWLASKSFVFLGYREYALTHDGALRATARPGSGLGLLRAPAPSRWASGAEVPAAIASRLGGAPLILMSKTNAASPVHRDAAMDDIAIKEVDARGTVIGVRRLIGLFTFRAEGQAASEIPILRQRLTAILDRQGVLAGSHDARNLVDLFNSFPREQLFTSRIEDVADAMRAISGAESALHVGLTCHADAAGRGLFVIALLPRARYSTELGERITAAVTRHLGGPILLDHLALDDRTVARLHYHVATAPTQLATPALTALREELGGLLRTWDDALAEELAALVPAAQRGEVVARYRAAFPAAYKAGTEIGAAARDVACIEALRASGEAQIELARPSPGAAPTLNLYASNETLVLSEFVPVLEHLGLRVLGEDVIALTMPAGERIAIHRFGVEGAAGGALDADRDGPRLVAALHAVRARRTVSDPLNALVLAAGLDWQAVAVLRAYVSRASQTGDGATATIVETLNANPACARALFALFAARFDPNASTQPPRERLAGTVAAAEAALQACIAAVPVLMHDRILRSLASAVSATVRANAYAIAPGAVLAIKLDLTQLPQSAAPASTEIWVEGVDLRGVHLRGGRVARGGIRFSDRPDDFRAEIMGLLRTQVVKNAVIVPVGAKGGFVVADAARGAIEPARVEAAYRRFIGALLSITDTLDRSGAKSPPGLVVYDPPDPYLVVAADKGTAAFSDIANEIAVERGFWLGDAFASGGSHGYDHKALAITARGAWECARQHFRELGRDLDRDAVRVAGIGDMSGDVFGNGLLRSRHLQLVAAFDHRHVFLDPQPDPERGYRERQRLFVLPRSTWADYAPAALGPGGGVYARDAKSIPVSPEVRALLEIDDPAPAGETVVRAILRLPVDLLWNGGIGTYVKAGDETHLDVADPANDAVRIDARELRATAVVEGGNLGLTQRARIEYALSGGHINTDAIDNSGGVDCSDHEVNLKIALQPLVANGTLGVEARHALLAEVAEPVCDAVLAHNRSQARALYLDQTRSRTRLPLFRDLMSILEAEAGMERQAAQMPTREALRIRRGLYSGLTRPELAVLLAHTKLDLQRRVLQSTLCDDPALEPLLHDYFPAAVRERFPHAATQHPLRHEIIAVQLAGQLVDTMGMTFLVRAVRDTGGDVLEVVQAWLAARLLVDGDGLDAELAAAAERLSGDADAQCALRIEDAFEVAVACLVPSVRTGQPLDTLVRPLREPVTTLLAQWPEGLGPRRAEAYAAEVRTLETAGVPPALARRVARLDGLGDALEITRVAAAANVSLPGAAGVYGELGTALDLDWLRRALPGALSADDRWEARAAAGLLDRLRATRRRLVLDVLAEPAAGASAAERVAAYSDTRRDQVDVILGLTHDLRAVAQPPLPALLVVLRELDRLVESDAGGGRA